MTQPKHTPEPWYRNIPPARKYNTIYAGRNTHICHLSNIGLTDEEIEANANLIFAAPELLAALEAAQEEIRLIRMKDANVVYNPALQAMMSVAIQKARGQQ